MFENSSKPKEISLSGEDFGDVTVQVNGVRVEVQSDGSVDAYTDAAVNRHSVKAAHEIGAIESAGEHKGEIYGGIYPADNKPIWFSAAPKLMDHYDAATWAQGARRFFADKEARGLSDDP